MRKNKHVQLKQDDLMRFLWKCLKILLALFFITVGLYYTYHILVEPAEDGDKVIMHNIYNLTAADELGEGDLLEQTFQLNNTTIDSFALNFKVTGSYEKNRFIVSLVDNDKATEIGVWNVEGDSLSPSDGQTYYRYYLPEGYKVDKATSLSIKIKIQETEGGLSVFRSVLNQCNSGSFSVNGKEIGGDLSFKIFSSKYTFPSSAYWIILIWALAGGVLLVLLVKKRAKCEYIFLESAIFLGVLYMFLMPPYTTPDERAHISTAYYYSNILLGQEALDKEGNVLVRNEDLLYNDTNRIPDMGSYNIMQENLFKMSQDNTMVSYERAPLGVPLYSYLPQILGISVARLLNLGNLPLLFLGRIFGLAFFIICVFFAIKVIPVGQRTLFTIALLPGSLWSGSSFSYDLIVNSVAFLIIGYSFFLIFEKEKVKFKDVLFLGFLILIVSSCKVVYVLLALLCVLIPVEKFSSKGKFYLSNVGIWAVGILSLAVSRISTIASMAMAEETYNNGSEGFTIMDVFNEPFHALRLGYNSIRKITDDILRPVFGGKLGFWDIDIPYYLVFGFCILVFLSTLLLIEEKVRINAKEKVVFVLVSCSVIAACMLAMLLDFTPSSSQLILGVQGRYFIPVLPLAALVFQSGNIRARNNLVSSCIIGIYAMNFLVLWRVFETILER